VELCFVTEPKPAAPDTVFAFVGRLLTRIQDDSAVCSASVAKDKISSGSGKIVKDCGMSCGSREWKRRVSSASDGLSGAMGLGSSREDPT
jgi:hypothetical protein